MDIMCSLLKNSSMSKKISKKASAIRTVSLAVGSLSLLLIAFNQLAEKDVCLTNFYSIDNQKIL
tara:strand:- start:538 stop:729 length:192 start_codon:yes stop_codon:yes gene_type:complete